MYLEMITASQTPLFLEPNSRNATPNRLDSSHVGAVLLVLDWNGICITYSMLPPIAEAGDSAEAGMLDSKPIFIAFVILVVLGLELLGGEARLLARSNRCTHLNL